MKASSPGSSRRWPGSKVERARAAAARSGAIIVYKGADTVVAAPDGRAAIATPLALAGQRRHRRRAGRHRSRRGAAAGEAPFEAACAGVWLHGRAAELAGPGLIADDLIGTQCCDARRVIVRLAARGDGVTESGRFVPMTGAGGRRLVGRDGRRPARTTRCRHAAISPNAAAASSSMSTTRLMRIS